MIAIFAHLLLTQSVLADRTIEGRVTVVRDVDTIIVAGTAVRLNGVDGPETSTRYGRVARAFMASIVQGETVTSCLNGERTHTDGSLVCYLNGDGIGAVAIANGYALDWRRHSAGRRIETSRAGRRAPAPTGFPIADEIERVAGGEWHDENCEVHLRDMS